MTPTVWLPPIVTVQVAVVAFGGAVSGEQFEEKPKTTPEVAVAVSVTGDPSTKSAVHEAPAPQLIPTGLLVTVPLPLPTGYTVKDGRLGWLVPGSTPKSEVAMTVVPFPNVVLAVITVVQGGFGAEQLTAVARPDELMVATFTSADPQVTEFGGKTWVVGMEL